jgi:UDP-N-acetylmuramoyl-tripeptide--D-alanyl-D-alanine ligase
MDWLAPDEPERVDPCKLLRVATVADAGNDSVLDALQRLALAVRRRWGKRVIGVTGSAGKTTTKEAIAQVLDARFHVLKSEGNLNNHFGLPLQLLKLEPEHDVAVIEMGMNHAGEIAALTRIAEPNWGVVSNVAPVHLEHFPEGIYGIARAKYELIAALPEDGVAVLNADDPYVAAFGRGLGERVVFYGTDWSAQVRAEEITDYGFDGILFTALAGGERIEVRLKLPGRHNVSNALSAIAVGLRSGMALSECAAALAELRPADRRGQLIEWRGAKIVNDCYNSNPRALDAMVDALLATPADRRIVVAGEMLELGPAGEELHAACGRRMAERGIDLVVGVRGLAEVLATAARTSSTESRFFPSTEETAAWLRGNLRPGDAVLFKASRGVRLERALTALLAP